MRSVQTLPAQLCDCRARSFETSIVIHGRDTGAHLFPSVRPRKGSARLPSKSQPIPLRIPCAAVPRSHPSGQPTPFERGRSRPAARARNPPPCGCAGHHRELAFAASPGATPKGRVFVARLASIGNAQTSKPRAKRERERNPVDTDGPLGELLRPRDARLGTMLREQRLRSCRLYLGRCGERGAWTAGGSSALPPRFVRSVCANEYVGILECNPHSPTNWLAATTLAAAIGKVWKECRLLLLPSTCSFRFDRLYTSIFRSSPKSLLRLSCNPRRVVRSVPSRIRRLPRRDAQTSHRDSRENLAARLFPSVHYRESSARWTLGTAFGAIAIVLR